MLKHMTYRYSTVIKYSSLHFFLANNKIKYNNNGSLWTNTEGATRALYEQHAHSSLLTLSSSLQSRATMGQRSRNDHYNHNNSTTSVKVQRGIYHNNKECHICVHTNTQGIPLGRLSSQSGNELKGTSTLFLFKKKSWLLRVGNGIATHIFFFLSITPVVLYYFPFHSNIDNKNIEKTVYF